MKIGSLQKLTLLDYPKKLACIIFFQGCPFRCHFCYNKSLVLKELFTPSIKEEEVFNFLKKRKNLLQAVVLSGGEPTMQKDLIPFIRKIKELNFKVKLDTMGIYPEKIKKLLNLKLVDYIAMDIKAPLKKYKNVINIDVKEESIKKSIKLI